MSEEKGIIGKLTDAVTGAGGVFKSTVDTVKGIQALHVDYSVKEKTFELLSKLMEIQSILISAKERIIELEDEKKQKENWEFEISKYELISPTAGSFIYRVKDSEQGDQPKTYLCPACYGERKKSMLQFHKMTSVGSTMAYLICHTCKCTYQIPADMLNNDFKSIK
ncbi:hypothetical protein [Xenorhabdus sp. KK7.4]|uniref:hypothetical protein n=1 Tax=Xenorhabdus sp. KK7.4 TaxID=1851572 RepID=UPI000C054ED4|nr:hypothetical protein [Xenorhabdus sp. KK7.4]PHM50152.1 hypothetical protein Xekk_04230 [Xenorhabdus sp. KK7.4]